MPVEMTDGGVIETLVAIFSVFVGGAAIYDQRVRRHETDDSPCNETLAQCFVNNETKEFKDHEQIDPKEFDDMLGAVKKDVDKGVRTPIDYARVTYDTPFYDGNPLIGPKTHKDQIVCIGDKCNHQSAVNYVAQGMYSAASGLTVDGARSSVQLWNSIWWRHDASKEEMYWTEYGYNYYNSQSKKK